MQRWVCICSVLILSIPALSQDRDAVTPKPDQFEVGRHTFFDVGPPFDFYELFLVRPTTTGSSIERVTITPPGISCMQPAMIETVTSSVNESVDVLLGKTNPCTIPEKELRREVKRCSKCLVFSGADVAMGVRCGTQDRIIRAHVLDKDMFDATPNIPEHTSWTMRLLARMDQALGSSVIDRPVFPLPEGDPKPPTNSGLLRDLSLGNYDSLFPGAPHKPSDLYRIAQKPPPNPDVQVQTTPPVRPEVFVLPAYPKMARVAHIEGTVTLRFRVKHDGSTSPPNFESGHRLLRRAVEQAVDAWRFRQEAADQEIQAIFEFKANCPVQAQ